jgi:hypothetical protein
VGKELGRFWVYSEYLEEPCEAFGKSKKEVACAWVYAYEHNHLDYAIANGSKDLLVTVFSDSEYEDAIHELSEWSTLVHYGTIFTVSGARQQPKYIAKECLLGAK